MLGAIFGGLAFAEKSAANHQCDAAGTCTSQGQSDISLKNASEVVSTVAIAAGIVAAGAGVYIVVRGHRHHDAPAGPAPVSVGIHPIVGAGTNGVLLSGTF